LEELYEKNTLNRINGQIKQANQKASNMYKKNLAHLENLDNIDEDTKKMILEAQEMNRTSKGVYAASYWLNKKYALLIYGSLTLLVLFIVLFIYRIIFG
jgi:hypothetical protein